VRRAVLGVPADRFAREIVRFLNSSGAALAAAERQAVGRQFNPYTHLRFKLLPMVTSVRDKESLFLGFIMGKSIRPTKKNRSISPFTLSEPDSARHLRSRSDWHERKNVS
jgi:hypothetical protein